MTPRPVRDPLTGEVLCWCGLVHPNDAAAGRCAHMPIPYTPGDATMTRPAYRPAHSRLQPGGTTYRPPAPRRWRRVALAILLLIIAAVITVEVAALYAEHHPAAPRPPASVPTTYGAPGPNGGPVAVRAACVAP